MFHLQQPAGMFVFRGVAAQEGRGDFAHGRCFFAGFDERALEMLLAEIDYLG